MVGFVVTPIAKAFDILLDAVVKKRQYCGCLLLHSCQFYVKVRMNTQAPHVVSRCDAYSTFQRNNIKDKAIVKAQLVKTILLTASLSSSLRTMIGLTNLKLSCLVHIQPAFVQSVRRHVEVCRCL